MVELTAHALDFGSHLVELFGHLGFDLSDFAFNQEAVSLYLCNLVILSVLVERVQIVLICRIISMVSCLQNSSFLFLELAPHFLTESLEFDPKVVDVIIDVFLKFSKGSRDILIFYERSDLLKKLLVLHTMRPQIVSEGLLLRFAAPAN